MEGKSGITVCMENVLDRHAAPLARVKNLVPHPDFGLCLDLGHAWCYGEDPLSVWTDTLKGLVRHVHVHDNDQSRDSHLAIGSGTLPFRQVLPAIALQNSPLTWTVECSAKEDVLASLQFLTKQRATADFSSSSPLSL